MGRSAAARLAAAAAVAVQLVVGGRMIRGGVVVFRIGGSAVLGGFADRVPVGGLGCNRGVLVSCQA